VGLETALTKTYGGGGELRSEFQPMILGYSITGSIHINMHKNYRRVI